ncbi:MAG: hypothetical protein ACOX05_02060 [Bacillota bacterium]
MRKSLPLVVLVVLLLIVLLLGSACDRREGMLLSQELKEKDVAQVQVVLAPGNPLYGSDSKIITDEAELAAMIEAFNGAQIEKEIPQNELLVGFSSVYYFFDAEDEIIASFTCSVNDSERVYQGDKCYHIIYPAATPFEIYQASQAEIIVVDENLDPLVRPQE